MGGCCCGSSEFRVRTDVPGQGASTLQLAKKLGLSTTDINKIFAAFNSFDMNRGGSVDIDEFIVVGRLEQSEMVAKLLFRLFDKNFNNSLEFEEFMCAVWNICSSDHNNLCVLTHQLFDLDDSGSIDGEEVAFIGNLFWHFRPPENVVIALKRMDNDRSGDITIQEFLHHMKNAELILQPVFEVQHFLRRFTMGQSTWEAITKVRNKRFYQQTIFQILNKSKSDQHAMKCAALDVAQREVTRETSHGVKPHVPDSAARKINKAHIFMQNVRHSGVAQNAAVSPESHSHPMHDPRSNDDGGHHPSHGKGNTHSEASRGHGDPSHRHTDHSHGDGDHSVLHQFNKDAIALENTGTQMGGGRMRGALHHHGGLDGIGKHDTDTIDENDVLSSISLSKPDKLKPKETPNHHHKAAYNRSIAVSMVYEMATGTAPVYTETHHEHKKHAHKEH